MTGGELIKLIEQAELQDREIDIEESYLVFSISENRNPLDKDDVRYVDYILDLENKTGRLHVF